LNANTVEGRKSPLLRILETGKEHLMRKFLLSFHRILLAGMPLLAILPPAAGLLAMPAERSTGITSPASSTGIILITPLQRENPAALKIRFPLPETVSHPLFLLFSHTGKKVWEKPLDFAASSGDVSGEQIFGGRIPLAAGYYFYQIRDSEFSPEFPAPFGQPYFNEVSQTHLPGDSLPAAFTEFVDVTGDSFPDIILGINTFTTPEQPQVFINDGGGHFSNETVARFPSLQLFVNDVAVFDADSDGDRDIYFAADDGSPGFENRDKLFLNDGQGFFSDVSATHLPPLPVISSNVDWGLVNDDVFPDLLVNTLVGPPPFQGTPVHILLNDGGGHFSESSNLLPQTGYNAYDAVLVDVNQDTRLDIALACLGDFIITDPQGNPIDTLSGRNAVFIQNSDGTFSDETVARMPDIVRWSKLMKVTDVNNDGAADLYSIDVGFSAAEALNVLYVNDGGGFFSDETALRLPPETVLWNNDAEFADFDRNGFADLFMINVVVGGPAPDFLYFNSGGFFSDESAHLPPINDFNASTAVADMERDGDADIFISVAPESLGAGLPIGLPDLLYENVLPPVGIAGEPGLQPEPFILFRNYPNPFNPETAISYQLSAASNLELAVYNSLGQKIRTLVQTRQPAGRYEVKWDGHDEAGREVGSGIYIYRLKARQYSISKKMILIR